MHTHVSFSPYLCFEDTETCSNFQTLHSKSLYLTHTRTHTQTQTHTGQAG